MWSLCASTDQGRTWSQLIDVEPADGPEASYAVLLKAPTGRVYTFYNHNTDNLRRVKADAAAYKSGWTTRVDTQGYYVFKFSDDGGRTWSRRRYPIPVREFEIDRENPYQGTVRFFWNVGKPFLHDGAAYVPLHKVGRFGAGFLARTEGVLLKSDNLLTAPDPEKVTWHTLPDGDIGLRAPEGGGPIAEEQNVCVLSDGSFFCVYRTVAGHPVCTVSRDGGHTWSPPAYMRYADGRLIKHPRAANFAWKCSNGKYLYWFHNHGGRSYADRNPAWLCGGIETDTPEGKVIRWSQPEIVLYDADPAVRMSYPDLIEDNGDFFLTETQKTIARVHPIDRTLLAGLWSQLENDTVATAGLVAELSGTQSRVVLPACASFAIDLWVEFASLSLGQVLLDSRNEAGWGLLLQTVSDSAVEIVLNDGRAEDRWGLRSELLRGRTVASHRRQRRRRPEDHYVRHRRQALRRRCDAPIRVGSLRRRSGCRDGRDHAPRGPEPERTYSSRAFLQPVPAHLRGRGQLPRGSGGAVNLDAGRRNGYTCRRCEQRILTRLSHGLSGNQDATAASQCDDATDGARNDRSRG